MKGLSALDAAGVQAARIENLWWIFFWVCTAVFVLVMGTLLIALFRKRGEPRPGGERRMARVVAGAVALSAVILIGLLVASVATGSAIGTPAPADALELEVIGHQWWWEVRYDHPVPSRSFTTANEIHIPVGRAVHVETRSSDVIHSFWVPNLHGKRDLIPGHPSELWLRADRPGVWRGQCAEFCGHQHANMGLLVVAEPVEQFQAWYDAQLRPAAPPRTPQALKGRQVFLSLPCPTCHTIAGTEAGGKTAPDLTHLASRRTLAAGTLPNTRGHLGGWILDSQDAKPGNKMPPVAMKSDDLLALLDYLESLR